MKFVSFLIATIISLFTLKAQAGAPFLTAPLEQRCEIFTGFMNAHVEAVKKTVKTKISPCFESYGLTGSHFTIDMEFDGKPKKGYRVIINKNTGEKTLKINFCVLSGPHSNCTDATEAKPLVFKLDDHILPTLSMTKVAESDFVNLHPANKNFLTNLRAFLQPHESEIKSFGMVYSQAVMAIVTKGVTLPTKKDPVEVQFMRGPNPSLGLLNPKVNISGFKECFQCSEAHCDKQLHYRFIDRLLFVSPLDKKSNTPHSVGAGWIWTKPDATKSDAWEFFCGLTHVSIGKN